MFMAFTGHLLPQVEFHYDHNPLTSGLMRPRDALGSPPPQKKRSGGGAGGRAGGQQEERLEEQARRTTRGSPKEVVRAEGIGVGAPRNSLNPPH